MKALIILSILLGLLMYGLIVATASPSNEEQYEAYKRYKERKQNERIHSQRK